MRKAAAAATLATVLSAAVVPAETLTVRVSGVKEAVGSVRVSVWKDASVFLRDMEKVAATKTLRATPGELTAVFDLPPGRYAVSVFHDRNENGKIDIGLMGPKEPYGFSRGVRPRFGRPSFDETAFDVQSAKEIAVVVR